MINSSFMKWQRLTSKFSYKVPSKRISSKGSFISPSEFLRRGVSQSAVTNSPGLLIAVFDFYEVMDILTSTTLKQNLIVPTDENDQGETMPVIACEFGSHGTLHRLKILFPDDFKKLCIKSERGPFVDCFLHRAIRSKSVETVSFLLNNGADVSEYVTGSSFDYWNDEFIRLRIVTGTTLHRAVNVNSAVILSILLEHAQTHLSKEELRELLLATDAENRSALYLVIEKTGLTEQRSDAMADLLLKYASSIGSLRPILLVGFRHAGSALNLYAEVFRSQYLDSDSEMLLVLLKHTSELTVEAKQELVSAVTSEKRTARDIAADHQREDQVAILDREFIWNIDIASGEDARGSPDDEEWYRLWKKQQREWRK